MNKGHTLFSQILSSLDPNEIKRCAEKSSTSRRTPALSAIEHFYIMEFAQLSNRQSIRSIALCLSAHQNSLYHSGIRNTPSKYALYYANEKRPYNFFLDMALLLVKKARRYYENEKNELVLDGEIFAVDATIIELTLSLFHWGK